MRREDENTSLRGWAKRALLRRGLSEIQVGEGRLRSRLRPAMMTQAGRALLAACGGLRGTAPRKRRLRLSPHLTPGRRAARHGEHEATLAPTRLLWSPPAAPCRPVYLKIKVGASLSRSGGCPWCHSFGAADYHDRPRLRGRGGDLSCRLGRCFTCVSGLDSDLASPG